MKVSAQLMVVLGAGGVGKTTSAAALALAGAERGLRTAVITVDPAKRLAQALGLQSLSNEAREVVRFASGGSLSALWLDTRAALAGLVEQHAKNIGDSRKILDHRLFKILQSQLGGIEEYLGVEKVLALGRSGEFDLCVLDTPPSRHALDFIDSPQHLLRFFDEGILRLFLNQSDEPAESVGFMKKLFNTGKSQALEIFKGFLGKTFLQELAELLTGLKPVQEALKETARHIDEWVKDPSTRFITVSLLERFPLEEAHLLEVELDARGLGSTDLRILNRCLPQTTPPDLSDLQKALGAPLAQDLLKNFTAQTQLRQWLATESRFKNFPPRARAEVPRYSPHELNRENLLQMGKRILSQWQEQEAKIFSKTSSAT